jgi:uncharacterized protein (TIGR02246 family)
MDTAAKREIEQACTALSHAFAYHLDRKEYEALANLFAPDGVFVRMGARLEGRKQINAVMSERPPEQFTRHISTNFHFTRVDADTAEAVVYNISYFGFPESALPLDYLSEQVMLLDFIDIYTRTDEGWRFLERKAQPLLIPKDLRSKMLAPAAATASH